MHSRSRILIIIHEDTLLAPKPIITYLKLLCNVWIRILGSSIKIAIRKHTGKISTEVCSTWETLKDIVSLIVEEIFLDRLTHIAIRITR